MKKTENTVNKSIRRMCLHLADMHIPLYFKNNCYTQDDWLIILFLTAEMRWKFDYGQQVAKDFAKGNHSIFHNFPPNVTTSKLCKDSIFGNLVWHCV
jgi:hypothetical protein